jgi:hypothetical protein
MAVQLNAAGDVCDHSTADQEGHMRHITFHSYLLSPFIHSEDVGLIEHDLVRRAAHACDMCSVGEHLDMCVDAACNRTQATNKAECAGKM